MGKQFWDSVLGPTWPRKTSICSIVQMKHLITTWSIKQRKTKQNSFKTITGTTEPCMSSCPSGLSVSCRSPFCQSEIQEHWGQGGGGLWGDRGRQGVLVLAGVALAGGSDLTWDL